MSVHCSHVKATVKREINLKVLSSLCVEGMSGGPGGLVPDSARLRLDLSSVSLASLTVLAVGSFLLP